MVICGVQLCFRFLSTWRKRCLTNQCVRKNKNQITAEKSHTSWLSFFNVTVSASRVFSTLSFCSLLDIKFTRCFHLYEAVWSVIWSEHKDVVRSGLEPELWGKGFCISKCLLCHEVWKFSTFINLTYLPASRHKRRLSHPHENDCRHSTARSTVKSWFNF